MSQPRIFISHNHNDNAYCREFVVALREDTGSDDAVWYDEHSLGWGKIRREIERELVQRQHFIAILSPSAVASDWVNDEIDAAIDLLRNGSMQTVQFVMALPCEMPLLLRNYKRVVAPDGQPYPAEEAARRALAVIQTSSSTSTYVSPMPSQPLPEAPIIPPDRFPRRLASLGFTAHNDKGVEYILPPLCLVPYGSFVMGSYGKSEAEAAKDEQPRQHVILQTYEISRFPITVAEYACFVRATPGEPGNWETQLNRLDHPVVAVTWHDAVAYAVWLARRTRERWSPPTEAEWEKAARGNRGRVYPWGNTFDGSVCNTSESSILDTTPVGSYPTGASPYGAEDMAGNVWEWTSSLYRPYPYSISDGREDSKSEGQRVLRGGSWGFGAASARTACRSGIRPSYFGGDLGFRLVRAASSS